jgi:hypothetical protein
MSPWRRPEMMKTRFVVTNLFVRWRIELVVIGFTEKINTKGQRIKGPKERPGASHLLSRLFLCPFDPLTLCVEPYTDLQTAIGSSRNE